MTLEIILPLGRQGEVKNLVFSILTNEYPLKIIELTNFIRKRYGKSVTFQAVRKALLELTAAGVLIKNDATFAINKEWVRQSKKLIDQLYVDLTKDHSSPKNIDSIHGEISVFTFDTLNHLMKFWQDLIDDWFEKHNTRNPNINCWQGAHGWEGLLHLDREKVMMGRLKKKGIKSYAVFTTFSPLDSNISKFYESVGLKVKIISSQSTFDKTYYVGTYGEMIVQTKIPTHLAEDLDSFFKNNKTLENMNLKELSDIVHKKAKVKLTVIKNLEMAKQINNSILVHFQ